MSDTETTDNQTSDVAEADTAPTTDSAEHIPVPQQLAVLGVIMLLIFGHGIVTKTLNALERRPAETPPAAAQSATIPATDNTDTEPEETADPFAEIGILGASAFVWDVQERRVLFQKNPDEQLPLASITKLMTALVAHELVTSDTTINISDTAIQQDGDSGFLNGEAFSLKNLLDLTLLSSSNDGAFAIANAIGSELAPAGNAATFVDAMNIRARDLGLTQTFFRNPTGLDISTTEGGAYGSARDVTFLMEHILTHYPAILEATKEAETAVRNEVGETYPADNTNPIVTEIPGLIGSKTGYTDLAGGNLAIAFDAALNRPIIVVVLGSTRNGRFEDVLTLVDGAESFIQ